MFQLAVTGEDTLYFKLAENALAAFRKNCRNLNADAKDLGLPAEEIPAPERNLPLFFSVNMEGVNYEVVLDHFKAKEGEKVKFQDA